jgi:hypothetical protein
MTMNTNNLGLSTMANGQLERMIDAAAWISYPLHSAVGVVKTFLFMLFLVFTVMLYTGIWLFTAHDTLPLRTMSSLLRLTQLPLRTQKMPSMNAARRSQTAASALLSGFGLLNQGEECKSLTSRT